MLRIASAASVLFAMSLSIGVLAASPAAAGYDGPGYPCYGWYYGGCGTRYSHWGTAYRPGFYGTYRSAYDGTRSYGGADRPARTAPYYVNGCYNGYSADGVRCHYFYFYGWPVPGYRY